MHDKVSTDATEYRLRTRYIENVLEWQSKLGNLRETFIGNPEVSEEINEVVDELNGLQSVLAQPMADDIIIDIQFEDHFFIILDECRILVQKYDR